MPVRAGVSIAVTATGVVLLLIARLRGRRLTWSVARIVLSLTVLAIATLLLINEAVRSDGAL